MTETTIKERPIIMTGESVRAILKGRKTQTRRVVNIFGLHFVGAGGKEGGDWNDPECWGFETFETDWFLLKTTPGDGAYELPCKYGGPGDRLWVRETWAKSDELEIHEHAKAGYTYRADWDNWDDMEQRDFKWKSPIHMPRWASRLTLEITNVRAQRLQDISEEDAAAEGVIELRPTTCSARDDYRAMWDAINGKKHPWESNPWIWALTFKVAA